MPNRVIKESICYSDDIDRLTPFEETVFYRLWVRVDDYGRIDARPGFLKSTLFVTKKGITDKNIEEAVAKLASVGLVQVYEVTGKPFLLFPKWSLHQRIRQSREKYPAPEQNEKNCEKPRNADNSTDIPQFAATCGELPLESESESESFSSEHDSDVESSDKKNNAKPKSRKKNVYGHDSECYNAAKWLADNIEQSVKGYKRHEETQLQSWADDMRLILEKDKRDKELTGKLLFFARNDPFWKTNILSMGKFREQYDQLLVKYYAKVGGAS